MQGVHNYVPEINRVSRVYIAAAVLYKQFVLYVMLFRRYYYIIIIIIIIVLALLNLECLMLLWNFSEMCFIKWQSRIKLLYF